MARRTRKKQSTSSNLLPIIIGALCALGLLAGGYFIITREKSSNATELNAETYTNSPESVRGSSFSVKAEVIKKLYYEEGVTQVVHVIYNNEHIPIEIPADVKGPNINTQQEYTFIVKAKNDAWLVAKSYTDK
ncbi:MAG: hypothetical protein QMC23_05925 [Rubritalea sp.]|jgi:hypothetical protein|tara:strand:- start:6245 stop:6643 length:399 start_codon:yes stop_codon:yes gene_type:complete